MEGYFCYYQPLLVVWHTGIYKNVVTPRYKYLLR
jgi:hypothetical protein